MELYVEMMSHLHTLSESQSRWSSCGEGQNGFTTLPLHGRGAPSVALTAQELLVVTSALRE